MRLVVTFFLLLAVGCSRTGAPAVEVPAAGAQPVADDHAALTTILQQHVDARGLVDYAALADDPAPLRRYLEALAATDPSELPSDDARLALWINAYNAYTLWLVAQSYPVEGIRETVGGPFVPRVNSPWEHAFAVVGGETYTLNEIEHEIIRPRFDEPRIHAALVCAAQSCPPLRREAFTADRLDRQLDDQMRAWLHDEDLNRIPAGRGEIALSKIFDWYGEDFGASEADLQRYLAPYFEGRLAERLAEAAYDVRYLDYDWSLNEQPR